MKLAICWEPCHIFLPSLALMENFPNTSFWLPIARFYQVYLYQYHSCRVWWESTILWAQILVCSAVSSQCCYNNPSPIGEVRYRFHVHNMYEAFPSIPRKNPNRHLSLTFIIIYLRSAHSLALKSRGYKHSSFLFPICTEACMKRLCFFSRYISSPHAYGFGSKAN